jgi:hypothetical protein
MKRLCKRNVRFDIHRVFFLERDVQEICGELHVAPCSATREAKKIGC